MQTLCACGSRKSSELCCLPFLSGQANAPTPEALMRSRFTAFCQANISYLMATHHPAQHRADDKQKLRATIQDTEWLGLKVINASPLKPTSTRGFVEFAAFYRSQGKPESVLRQLHERSQFMKEGGQWYYVQGEMLPPISLTRNEPCWCGSGQKYKRCHGRAG